MRAVFRVTRQLSAEEWQEYWAMERVNERGVYIDEKMVAQAARLAEEDKRRSCFELERLTECRTVTSVDQVARLTDWLLPAAAAGGPRRPAQAGGGDRRGRRRHPDALKFTLTRAQVERLIALVADRPAPDPHRRAARAPDPTLWRLQDPDQVRPRHGPGRRRRPLRSSTCSMAPPRPGGPRRRASRSTIWRATR